MTEAAVMDSEQPKSRSLTLGDLMVLIVPLALGLALAGPGVVIIADAICSAPRSHPSGLIFEPPNLGKATAMSLGAAERG